MDSLRVHCSLQLSALSEDLREGGSYSRIIPVTSHHNSSAAGRFVTKEHVADDATEALAVESRGGVIEVSACAEEPARVNGELEVTRALGDLSLKPAVSPTPDVFTTDITSDMVMLIVASDGLWDQVSIDDVVRPRFPLCLLMLAPFEVARRNVLEVSVHPLLHGLQCPAPAYSTVSQTAIFLLLAREVLHCTFHILARQSPGCRLCHASLAIHLWLTLSSPFSHADPREQASRSQSGGAAAVQARVRQQRPPR